MLRILLRLLDDEGGFIVSGELVLIATILGLGMIVGLSGVASAINDELADVASAVVRLNQGFQFSQPAPAADRNAGGDIACRRGDL